MQPEPLPFVYDEVRSPNAMWFEQLGDSFGFIPVRIGDKWSVLLLAERESDMAILAEHAGPFVHDTAEAAAEWTMRNRRSFALASVELSRPWDF